MAGVLDEMRGRLGGVALDVLYWLGDTIGRFLRWLAPGKTPLEVIQSVVTMATIVFGAWWTVRTFSRGRVGYPRCDLTLRAAHRPLDDGTALLHVEACLRNHGSALAELAPRSGFVRLHQVLPLGVDLSEQRVAMAAQCAIPEGAELPPLPRVVWPMLGEDCFPNERNEVEPGETETFDFDFSIAADVRTLRIYAHCRNLRKRRRWYWSGFRMRRRQHTDIGWKAALLYDIEPPAGGPMMVTDDKEGRIDHQEGPEDRPVRVGSVRPAPQPSAPKTPAPAPPAREEKNEP